MKEQEESRGNEQTTQISEAVERLTRMFLYICCCMNSLCLLSLLFSSSHHQIHFQIQAEARRDPRHRGRLDIVALIFPLIRRSRSLQVACIGSMEIAREGTEAQGALAEEEGEQRNN